jgi:ABC-type dipeptide/oligopeptide/nickel transport system ATPase subunit
LLRLTEVTKVFDQRYGFASTRAGQQHRAFGPIDLTIGAGESVALIGRSGSGKSSLARCIAGLDAFTQGSLWTDGTPVAQGHPTPGVQLVFQDSPTALNPRWQVAELVREPLLLAGQAESADDLAHRLEEVSLDSSKLLSRLPSQLSGGQRQRVAIARALAAPGVRLLILDEPLAGLDPETADKICKLLVDLQTTRALSLLYISHDLARVAQLAGRIVVLASGRIVEDLPASRFPAAAAHPETLALLAAQLPEPAA